MEVELAKYDENDEASHQCETCSIGIFYIKSKVIITKHCNDQIFEIASFKVSPDALVSESVENITSIVSALHEPFGERKLRVCSSIFNNQERDCDDLQGLIWKDLESKSIMYDPNSIVDNETDDDDDSYSYVEELVSDDDDNNDNQSENDDCCNDSNDECPLLIDENEEDNNESQLVGDQSEIDSAFQNAIAHNVSNDDESDESDENEIEGSVQASSDGNDEEDVKGEYSDNENSDESSNDDSQSDNDNENEETENFVNDLVILPPLYIEAATTVLVRIQDHVKSFDLWPLDDLSSILTYAAAYCQFQQTQKNLNAQEEENDEKQSQLNENESENDESDNDDNDNESDIMDNEECNVVPSHLSLGVERTGKLLDAGYIILPTEYEYENESMLQNGDCISVFRKHETLDQMIEQDDTIELFVSSKDFDFAESDNEMDDDIENVVDDNDDYQYAPLAIEDGQENDDDDEDNDDDNEEEEDNYYVTHASDEEEEDDDNNDDYQNEYDQDEYEDEQEEQDYNDDDDIDEEDDYKQYLQMIVRLSYKVIDIKYLILMSQKQQFGFTFLKVNDIDLKYNGEILNDWTSLEEYGIDDEEHVEVVLK